MTVWGDIGGVDSTSRIPGDTHGDPVHVVCPAAQRARKGGGSGSLPSPPPGRFGKTEGRPQLSAKELRGPCLCVRVHARNRMKTFSLPTVGQN